MKDLHIKIKQFRIVYISLLLFVCFMTFDMWEWYKLNADTIEAAGAGGFSAAFLAFAGMIKFGLEGLRQDSEHD